MSAIEIEQGSKHNGLKLLRKAHLEFDSYASGDMESGWNLSDEPSDEQNTNFSLPNLAILPQPMLYGVQPHPPMMLQPSPVDPRHIMNQNFASTIRSSSESTSGLAAFNSLDIFNPTPQIQWTSHISCTSNMPTPTLSPPVSTPVLASTVANVEDESVTRRDIVRAGCANCYVSLTLIDWRLISWLAQNQLYLKIVTSHCDCFFVVVIPPIGLSQN